MTTRENVLLVAVLMAPACGPAPARPDDRADLQAPAEPAKEAAQTASPPADFRRDLELLGVAFRVAATNAGPQSTLTITPSGTTQNAAVTRQIDGTVKDALVADLNVDGLPEVYVHVGAGSGSYGSLVAYTVSKGPALLEIYLPPVADDPVHGKGYVGHDEFDVIENTFVQRFPLSNPGDVNAAPTGKTRQLQYKLVAGENGWRLKLDKAVEY
jgi:hypothetical protein